MACAASQSCSAHQLVVSVWFVAAHKCFNVGGWSFRETTCLEESVAGRAPLQQVSARAGVCDCRLAFKLKPQAHSKVMELAQFLLICVFDSLVALYTGSTCTFAIKRQWKLPSECKSFRTLQLSRLSCCVAFSGAFSNSATSRQVSSTFVFGVDKLAAKNC